MKKLSQILFIACVCTGLAAVMGARGGCVPDPCPNLHIACPDLECPDGFQVDKSGCAICECIGEPAPLTCLSDDECRDGQHCDMQNYCEPSPGCEEGMDCLALCYGLCVDDEPLPCTSDFECERGLVCADGVCVEPRPDGCMSDDECPAGLVCDTMNFCDPMPGCDEGMPCPTVCYGRCVEPNQPLYCIDDADCPEGLLCEMYFDQPTTCAGDDPEGDGTCDLEPYPMGICVPFACPDFAPPYCPEGEIVSPGYDDNGCPLPPICVTFCEGLDPERCMATDGCMLLDVEPCYCDGCFPEDDASCFCDCPVVEPICVPEQPIDRCEQLGEWECIENPGCEPLYMGVSCGCAICEEGTDCPPCDCPDEPYEQFAGCVERGPETCFDLSQDECETRDECMLVEMQLGMPCYCDCPAGDNDCVCEPCDDTAWACVPREPPPPAECLSDDDCRDGFFCALMDCAAPGDETSTDCGFGGVCLPLEPPPPICGDGTEPLCDMIPPVCDDSQVLAVFNFCWVCVEPERCEPTLTCANVRCEAGTHCEMQDVQCFTEPCYPIPVCVPDAAACQSDDDCGEGFFCNSCPPDPTCPMCDVCGPPVCQPIAPPPPPVCGDGSQLSCRMMVPVCDDGLVVGVFNGCYECVPADQCEPTLTCANVRCEAGTHCEMLQVQCFTEPCYPVPACVPDQTDPYVCEDGSMCPDGSQCVNGRCQE